MSLLLEPTAQDLSHFNTLGLASRAQACVTLDDEAQLPALTALLRRYPSWFVLGAGSNMVLGASLAGLVIRMGLRGLRLVDVRHDNWIVEAAAGERWHDFVAYCVAQGWGGLENLALIPGTVGAAPVQNIGAYGVELADRFHSLSAWDTQASRLMQLSAQDCRFAYRDSHFKHEARWIITRVRFALPRPWKAVLAYPDLQRWPALQQGKPDAQAIFNAVCNIRRAKLPDPAVIGNAGSFFKNPLVDAETRGRLLAAHPGLVSYPQADGRYKLAAGWLIDQCGWKGRSLGPAGVHDRQALVLVNRGGATAADIMALARAIQDDVMARYGVRLEPEPVLQA
ncbi:UDP-N-acetylmuramate dehydrogenase [Bordetella avium]|uniref:UDP-N-acetylmuramate dehydrogenase n=1 Tax=Bordetella avium TaxID=521 RepID=UPI000E0B3943|nr:UDP-N-acetylmuramate dehydrogenase [Bordetella avium]RIQ12983.1 UDP-N-acetylmuramate dehydrogenase [Bordetella avium]RIQ37545.1 UDP-N-acetylmuramate dehydrogenase [Bordetella avium]RIQ42327.1 UDP-N-acetylmuramate dehydrogenase [Bordetella avium]RIQ42776.1 UDP-N-acetylmuramate dehydrogenase [Bordetella avium]RIQ49239.1 UDP-N-acetylmuramate dehydrogenase [Bordetella avium]